MTAESAFDDAPDRESVWLTRSRMRSTVASLLAVVGPSGATYAVANLPLGRFQGLGYVASVVAAALVGRLLPALVAVLATAGLLVYWVLPPTGLAWPSEPDSVDLALLLTLCAFLAIVISALARARSAALQALASARRAEQKLTVLSKASAAMSSSFDIAATSRRACQLVIELGGWEHCAVALDEGPQASVLASASVAQPKRRARWWRRARPAPATITSAALPTGLRVPQVLRPDGRPHGIGPWTYRSGLIMPLLVDGKPAGSLVLLHETKGLRHTQAAFAFATELANRISGAIAAARRYAAESEIAQTLQRNLLPRQLPEVPGVQVHAAYHAGGRTVAGGDFYDLFPVDESRWMVVVGDVCGKGPEAASVMGITRASLRAIALREHSPAQLMAQVNDALRDQVGDQRFVSACAAVLEPQADGEVAVTMCRAGHPPAVVRQASGDVGLVGEAGGPVLGVLPSVAFSEEKFVLTHGDRLVLYTDGVERPGGAADDVALLLVSQHGADAADVLAEQFAQAMRSGGEGNADDLAVVILTVDGTADHD
jgi:hypothetical protein